MDTPPSHMHTVYRYDASHRAVHAAASLALDTGAAMVPGVAPGGPAGGVAGHGAADAAGGDTAPLRAGDGGGGEPRARVVRWDANANTRTPIAVCFVCFVW
jgi:hypothetical protein